MASMAVPVHGKKRKASRLWWHVHQWVGFKLALFMSFICLTGTLAVFSSEMDWVLQPSLRVAPSSVAGEPDWVRIAANATRYPRVASINSIDAPTASAFAVRVMVEWDDNRLGFLNVHPTTGVVQGEGPWVGAQRIFRNMHRHLNLPGRIGIPIVTSLSFLLLISVGTSFVVYKKWWRGFFKPLRTRDARVWWGDFHRLAGLWSVWFVALIAVTGLWYFVEQMGGQAPVPRAEAVEPYVAGLPEIGDHLATSLAAARRADPELRITGVGFPTEKSGAFVFIGDKSAILVRPRTNAVWTEVATGKVVAKFDGRDLNVHQRISEMADPLHFGYFGGYWTKVPWFIFGLLMTGLSVSGVVIYALRIGRDVRGQVAQLPGWRIAWRGMGVWSWLAALAIIVAFVEIRTLLAQTAE
jgi:uncharacterized iron-regulated membrane protein